MMGRVVSECLGFCVCFGAVHGGANRLGHRALERFIAAIVVAVVGRSREVLQRTSCMAAM